MPLCLLALLVAFAGYAYVHDPSGCKKLLDDACSVVGSVLPVPLHPDTAPAKVIAAAPITPKQPPVPAPAPAPASASAVPNPPPPVTTAPASSSVPNPVPASTPAPAARSPDAVKPWAPPDVMPAQPNWTWQTSDGATYQNVVVTKIEPDTVTIMHSMGVAHIPILLLPPDIQKQLNYDPHAASHGN
jgi:hypothetical protein